MIPSRKRIAQSALLLGLFLAAACGDTPTQAGGDGGDGGVDGGPGGGGGNPGPVVADSGVVDHVQITPDTLTLLAQGGHRMLQATARNRYGAALQGRMVHYSSSDGSVAHVDGSGNVTGLNAGRAVITASLDGKQAQARVEVLPLTVDSLALGAAHLQVQWGTTRLLGAAAFAADGRVLDRPLLWTSSDTAVATVDGSGRVTGVRGGRAWITVFADGRTARAEVTVPDLKEMTLAAVDGGAVPSVLVADSLHDDGGGSFRRVRMVATQGTLRMSSHAGVYTQEVMLRVTTTYLTCTQWMSCITDGPDRVEVRQVYDHGGLERNVYTGEPIFVSRAVEGMRYYAQNAPGDGLTVWQALPGTGAYLRWLYRLPAE